jgi:putative hydrolase of the HAD superfamily
VNPLPIKAILYDAGRTLVRPRPALEEVWNFLSRQLALDIPREQRERRFPDVGHFYYARLGKDGLGAYESDDRARSFWSEYFAHALAHVGVDAERPALLSAGHAVYEWYRDPSQWQLYREVKQALTRAQERGLTQGVVSDWGTDLPALLHAHELTEHLDFVVASAAVGVSKPHPEIFRFALDRAGLTASQAVYVGDSYVADVLGARNVGLLPILLDRDGRAPAVDCPVVSSLDEVLSVVEALPPP